MLRKLSLVLFLVSSLTLFGCSNSGTVSGYSISGTVSEGEDPLANATVTLSGDASRTEITDNEGKYAFTRLSIGLYTVTPSLDDYYFSPENQSVELISLNIIADFVTFITCIDNDDDGFGDPADDTCDSPELDCNDDDGEIYPGATKICDDGIDNDCEGGIDCTDISCIGSEDCLITDYTGNYTLFFEGELATYSETAEISIGETGNIKGMIVQFFSLSGTLDGEGNVYFTDGYVTYTGIITETGYITGSCSGLFSGSFWGYINRDTDDTGTTGSTGSNG